MDSDHTPQRMKLDSKYFDSVRVRRGEAKPDAGAMPCCDWKGCNNPGQYRAPRRRGVDGQYFLFCLDHIREFNASYNYFEGWSNEEVAAYQKDSVIGHRPTWKTGANAWAHGTRADADATPGASRRVNDPHDFFAWRANKGADEAQPRRSLKPLERKALETLNLEVTASREQIKARFKEQVKLHHPDLHGGDKRSEDKLREIIQAYNYLKQAGLV